MVRKNTEWTNNMVWKNTEETERWSGRRLNMLTVRRKPEGQEEDIVDRQDDQDRDRMDN